MLSFVVKDDFARVAREIDDRFKRQIPFAAAKALTKTAQIAKGDVRAEMVRVFDRPTPFTLNSTYIRPATKTTLSARVWLKDDVFKGTPAAKYLMPQIAGGDRSMKRFERALASGGYLPPGYLVVPGRGARYDSYGNVSRGQITQVLSWLRTSPDAMQNRSTRTSKRGAKRGGYFVGRPGNAPLGVWQRTAAGNVLPIFIFVQGARYSPRLDFAGVVRRAVERNLIREFRASLVAAMRTAR